MGDGLMERQAIPALMEWRVWLTRVALSLYLLLVVLAYSTAGTGLFTPIVLLVLVALVLFLFGFYASDETEGNDVLET